MRISKFIKKIEILSIGSVMLLTAVVNQASAAISTLTFINLNPVEASIAVGETMQMLAAPLDAASNQCDVAGGGCSGVVITYSSSDPAIASVDVNTGLVTGVAAGTVTIAATGVDGATTITTTGADASTITVTPAVIPILTSLLFNQTALSVDAGLTQSLTPPTPIDQSGLTFTGATITYSSEDPTIATVDVNTGLVTGVAAGTTRIFVTASSGSVTLNGVIIVTVGATTNVSFTLNPGWNLITMPIQPVDPVTGLNINYTAETLGQLANADIITTWLAATQQYQSHIVGFPINDFSVGNSVGVFVHVVSTKTISLTGTIFPSTSPTISSGWNLIGYNNNATTSADTFGLTMTGADVVTSWNSATQTWLSHIMNFPLNNFSVSQGDALFIHKP